MQELLTQKFQYAVIIPYKDYCNILDEPVFKNFNEDEYLFSKSRQFQVALPPPTKKNISYFNKGTENEKDIKVKLINPLKSEFYTTNDRQIKRHFGRPFSEISIHTIGRKIVKRGDKITIKTYRGQKIRSVNHKFFRRFYTSISISINIKTGNFIITKSSKTGKTRSSTFKTNCFNHLTENFLDPMFSIGLHSLREKEKSRYKVGKMFEKQFDDKVFITELEKVLGDQRGTHKWDKKNFYNSVLNLFIDKKKIKIPNGNYKYWIENFYPTEKYLKKNDRKLFASVLDMIGIKSKVTVKILHDNPEIDLHGLYVICRLFGNDYQKYVGNIKSVILTNSLRDSSSHLNCQNKHSILNDTIKNRIFDLSTSEKDCLLKLINSTKIGEDTLIQHNKISLLMDHVNMIQKLRPFDPNIKFNARNMTEFQDEHREFSKMISAIRKGWVLEYKYDERLLKELQVPINSHYFLDENETEAAMEIIYPKVLTREEEYAEEGSFMHHCVASYSDKDTSMIISLRTESHENRVTCEFEIQTGKCIQTRHFCNGVPPKMFDEAILIVKEKVIRNAKWGTLNWKEKIKVPVKVNGKSIDIELLNPTRNVFDIMF